MEILGFVFIDRSFFCHEDVLEAVRHRHTLK